MQKNYVKKLTLALIISEYVIHTLVAVLLVVAAIGVFVHSFKQFDGFSPITVFMLINNALLMLIIKEILWSVVRFFKHQSFNLSSFIYIGIISGIRQLLLIEIQKSVTKMAPFEFIIEQGVYSLTILILIIGYYMLKKADMFKNLKRNQKGPLS